MGEDTPLWVTFDFSGTGLPIVDVSESDDGSVVIHTGDAEEI